MGFFDRSPGKKDSAPPASSSADEIAPAGASPVLPQLMAARERLEAKDLPAALVLYEEALVLAGDRADVLVTISGDLGTNGYIREIVELVASRYDAERHGPATGLNVLQAYLVLQNAEAAQHVLDILFSLQRPELEERLHGFSNAIAELIQQDAPPLDASGAPLAIDKVNLVSISKPIWFYGLEAFAGQILPPKTGKLRRVAFTQLALPGVTNLAEMTKLPEEELGRLTRALPLWLAETFYFSPHYLPIAAVGIMNQRHYALIGPEWSTDNLRQLVDTTDGGLDYIFTGSLKQTAGEHELVMRVWEVKKFRERKVFTVRWNASSADTELLQLHEQIQTFMEWSPEKTGVIYAPPKRPSVWLDLLGATLSLFFVGKSLLPKQQLVLPEALINAAAEQASTGESASLAWLNLRRTAREHGVTQELAEMQLWSTLLVKEVQHALT